MLIEYNQCSFAKKVGPLCRTQKPCKNGALCRDSCSPPFFECINCDARNTGLHCDSKKGEEPSIRTYP